MHQIQRVFFSNLLLTIGFLGGLNSQKVKRPLHILFEHFAKYLINYDALPPKLFGCELGAQPQTQIRRVLGVGHHGP